MSVLWLRARIICDNCGKPHDVEIDPAAPCDNGFEAIAEAMRGGEGSYFDNVMRCEPCTDKYVEDWIASHPHHISRLSTTDEGWQIETYAGAKHTILTTHPLGAPTFDADFKPYLAEPLHLKATEATHP